MQNYLTLDETIEKLKANNSKNLSSLIVQEALTPVFYYVGHMVIVGDDQAIISEYGTRVLKPELSNDLLALIEGRKGIVNLTWVESSPKIMKGNFDDRTLELFGYQNIKFILYNYEVTDTPTSFPIDINVFIKQHPNDFVFTLDRSMLLINEHELNIYLAKESPKKEIKRGVSRAKMDAKLAACTLAEYLWQQDTEKKIRTDEMTQKIYEHLYLTHHREQLPGEKESLRPWIIDIARKYPHAQEPGRPENG
ncbi:hypothetical protein KTH73_04170 [Acinetobacter courvalinii]|uniref:hypothetical protein n=1 Tax=Acinetobacter courvalinii TaxID=280147 RepID=UPI0021CDC410|nr:hypothetical protein [Acinetobacter courvalinii]MCU4389923.1 hypothetical protein [Acinetobacter courvalinii]